MLSCHSPTGVAAKKAISWDKYNHYVGDIKDGSKILEQFPRLKQLPENTRRFLDKFFSPSSMPRSMRSESMVTCMTCHEIHDDRKMFLREEAADGTLCTHCHQEQKDVTASSHGVEKLSKSCISCHQAHNSESINLVMNSAKDDGCTSCHTNAMTEQKSKTLLSAMPEDLVWQGYSHPAGIDNSTHFPMPMKQRDDSRFTCTSCHDPHAKQDNANPVKRNFLWTDASIQNRDDFCTKCHSDQKDTIGSAHAIDPVKQKIVNIRTGRTGESCDLCHTVHKAETEKNIFAVKGTFTSNDDFCVVCHKTGGDAEDKAINLMKGHKVGKLDKDPNPQIVQFLATADNHTYSIECKSCHEPHRNGPKLGVEGDFATSFIRDLDSQKYNLCVNCHFENETLMSGGHFVGNFDNKTAEILKRVKNHDSCGACHTPHNSSPKFLMSGDTSKGRCMECHSTGRMSDRTVYTSHEQDVDLKDRNTASLPLEDNGVVCKTCHEPHRSVKALIRPEVKHTEDLCITCHEAQKPVVVSKHNMILSGTKNSEMIALADNNACSPCHAAHNFATDGSFMWPQEVRGNLDFVGNACLECHRVGGTAPDRVPKYVTHSLLFRMFVLSPQYRDYLRGWDGKISASGEVRCSTCHDPHVWSPDPAKRNEALHIQNLDGDNNTSFLKKGVAQDFCKVCHDDADARFDKFHTDEFRKKDTGTQTRGILKKILNFGGGR